MKYIEEKPRDHSKYKNIRSLDHIDSGNDTKVTPANALFACLFTPTKQEGMNEFRSDEAASV